MSQQNASNSGLSKTHSFKGVNYAKNKQKTHLKTTVLVCYVVFFIQHFIRNQFKIIIK